MSNLHYYTPEWIVEDDETLRADVCVYGGTSAGVVAAATAARRGMKVLLLHPGKHLGGMSSGGLGWTDYGRRHVIGGMSRQFYRDCGKHYGKQEEWHFEPFVAESVFHQMIAQAKVPVRLCQYLDAVSMDGRRIAAVHMLGGLTVEARQFIDATYEGDLLASAGVSFTIGRESNAQYGEELNGIQVRHYHQFSHPVDPYVTPGDPASGLLPQVIDEDLSQHIGEGDCRVQAYNFRVCMTDDPDLKVDWQQPEGYDPLQYELANRWYSGEMDDYNNPFRGWDDKPTDTHLKFDILANKTPGGFCKTDTNNHGPVSSDFIGANHDWPEADYEARERIFQAHVTYQQGFYWHMSNCPEIPERFRKAVGRWGLPHDEFVDTGHWPHQLYVREARRMVSDYVITENDCRGTSRPDDPIGMASYTMDSHNCARFVKIEDGVARVLNEGDVQVPPTDPYPVSYRAVVPKRGECENLGVPVCLSASHIAYGSARMEPVFMLLGESVALAASLAVKGACPMQEVPYDKLQPLLIDARQVLAMPAGE